MNFLSLFSGIGGFDLGLEAAGMKCIGQVEIDPFCQKVLAHYWPEVKQIGDIKNVRGDEFGTVGLVCGGVPCQPASCAGKRKGSKDDRWLWPETFRIVRSIKPAWCLFENVRGITSLESGVVFDNLLSELESYGYEVQAFCIPACAVDAPHRRDRIWIVAHATSTRERRIERDFCEAECGSRKSLFQRINRAGEDVAHTEQFRGGWAGRLQEFGKTKGKMEETSNQFKGTGNNVSNPDGTGFEEQRRTEPIQSTHDSIKYVSENVADTLHDGSYRTEGNAPESCGNEPGNGISERVCVWLPEPGVGRVANGVPNRVDRLRSLGNAVVPQIVEIFGRAIMYSENFSQKGFEP
jgi:DNA (cytosine-5)-methyltransferase 1